MFCLIFLIIVKIEEKDILNLIFVSIKEYF